MYVHWKQSMVIDLMVENTLFRLNIVFQTKYIVWQLVSLSEENQVVGMLS